MLKITLCVLIAIVALLGTMAARPQAGVITLILGDDEEIAILSFVLNSISKSKHLHRPIMADIRGRKVVVFNPDDYGIDRASLTRFRPGRVMTGQSPGSLPRL
jgi:hypothetical protein